MLVTDPCAHLGNVSAREDPGEAPVRAGDRREPKEDCATATTTRRTTRAIRTGAQAR